MTMFIYMCVYIYIKDYVFQNVFNHKIGIRIQVSWFLNQYLYSLPLASSNCIRRTPFHSREIFSFLRQLIRRPTFLETCLLYGRLESVLLCFADVRAPHAFLMWRN